MRSVGTEGSYRGMLASFMIFVGVSMAAAKLIDFYMSDGQKKWLDDKVVHMWDWLDRAKRVPVLDTIRTPKSQRILVAILTAIGACVLIIPPLYSGGYKFDSTESYELSTIIVVTVMQAVTIVIITAMAWFASRIAPVILRGRTALQLFAKIGRAHV